MNYSLLPIEGSGGPAITLARPVLLVGRHPECDVRINQSKISRRHCCLAMAYDRVLIRDLGSRNGVRVNGRIVQESRLLPDDEIAIGPLIYRVVARPDPGEAAGQPGAQRPTPSAVPAGDLPASPAKSNSEEIGLVPIDSF